MDVWYNGEIGVHTQVKKNKFNLDNDECYN